MSVVESLSKIRATIVTGVQLVAVSKTYPNEVIMQAYNAGQRIFGESRPQELVQKQQQLPHDIQWHFIGHLQTNKVKYIVPFVACIQSVDSVKLFDEIAKHASKIQRTVNCLLQIHIAQEDTKFGFSALELEEFLASKQYQQNPYIRICGLMGMATNTDNVEQVRAEFKGLKELFVKTKKQFFANEPYFKEISMGMSGDYLLAIAEGATIVRIGSLLFGERPTI